MAGKTIKAVPKAAVADLGGGGDVKGRAREQRKAKNKRRQSLLWGEALEIAKTYDIPVTTGNSLVVVLQTVLDRLMDKWRMVCQRVDQLPQEEWLSSKVDAEGNVLVEPNIWIQYEATLRAELADLALRMGHLGVDERKVRVQEAQIELLGRAVAAATRRAGLDPETTRTVGQYLREELAAADEEAANAPITVTRYADRVRQKRKNDKHPDIDGDAHAA